MQRQKFDYAQFFKWLAIGFSLASIGTAIAIGLYFYTLVKNPPPHQKSLILTTPTQKQNK